MDRPLDPGCDRRCGPSAGRAAAIAVVCASMLFAGCATSRLSTSRPAEHGAGGSGGSLETYIGKVRARSALTRPQTGSPFAVTLETWDRRLAAALAQLSVAPTAEHHRLVAEEYRRLGVLDMALSHLTEATRLDSTDAAAFDGLARIWRDMGVAHLGLADARRAVQLAPASPVAANTLGTLLSAIGAPRAAQKWYSRALELNPGASYALTNLCYTFVTLADAGAVAACRRAAMLSPESAAARNNLALAYAAEGNFAEAQAEFQSVGDPSAADFNMGIVYMARHDFRKAERAFKAAAMATPNSRVIAARIQQAASAADREEGQR